MVEEREGQKPKHWAKPFEVTRDDEDRAKDEGRTITLRLNAKELALLEEQKELLDTDIDGTALKSFWKIGWNVTHSVFGRETVAWIASRDRTRKRRNPHKNIKNVLQEKGADVPQSNGGG